MTIHRFAPTRYHTAIGAHEPVLRIADGDTVITTTLDARGQDERGEKIAPAPNPMTGPFFVEGAEPGDTLAVAIDRLTPTRDWGFTWSCVAANVVEPEFVRELPVPQTAFWAIDRDAQTVALREPPDRLRDLVLPLAPMLGCFGVAAAHGQAISTMR